MVRVSQKKEQLPFDLKMKNLVKIEIKINIKIKIKIKIKFMSC